MYNETRRPNVTCPLIDDFHVKNILGARERRQIAFGTTIYMDGSAVYLDEYLSTITGGLITKALSWGDINSADHYQVLLQQIGVWSGSAIPANIAGTSAPTIPPYVASKTATSFRVHADAHAVLDMIILVTLPKNPRANSKDAWSYCPYCKAFGFKDIVGSIIKDATLFAGRGVTSGTALAVKFSDITAPTRTLGGYDGSVSKSIGGGTLHKPLVTTMEYVDATSYQVVLINSAYTPDVPTVYPRVSSKTSSGFTITGNDTQYYDILVFGQVKN